MGYSTSDEIRYLARMAIEGISRRGKTALASESRSMLEHAEALISSGKTEEGLREAVVAQEESMRVFNSIS